VTYDLCALGWYGFQRLYDVLLEHEAGLSRTAWKGHADRWRLACLGRVEAGKGIDVAIAALRSLPEASLTIDGPADPAYRASLEAGDRVHFIRTPADAVASAYAAADAILFPVTWPEPFGLVRLGAMSVGRPVIATGTGGSAEYLRDGENCLRVPPGDADAWPRRSAGWRATRRCAPAGGGRPGDRRPPDPACVRGARRGAARGGGGVTRTTRGSPYRARGTWRAPRRSARVRAPGRPARPVRAASARSRPG